MMLGFWGVRLELSGEWGRSTMSKQLTSCWWSFSETWTSSLSSFGRLGSSSGNSTLPQSMSTVQREACMGKVSDVGHRSHTLIHSLCSSLPLPPSLPPSLPLSLSLSLSPLCPPLSLFPSFTLYSFSNSFPSLLFSIVYNIHTHKNTHSSSLLTTFGRFRYFASTEFGSTLSPMM